MIGQDPGQHPQHAAAAAAPELKAQDPGGRGHRGLGQLLPRGQDIMYI